MYAGQEATVTTRHGTTDWFQMGKGVRQDCISSPCLFNSYAEYIMQNAKLDEAQAEIKTARRNMNSLRYADDITFMAENEEELKGLLKMKEKSEKVGLKLNIEKTKIRASGPITLWQIYRVKLETVTDFIFLGSRITADDDCSHEIKRCLLLVRKILSLLFNMLSRFIIAFPPRSKHVLISWLQRPSTVTLEPKKGNLSLLPSFPLLFTMK